MKMIRKGILLAVLLGGVMAVAVPASLFAAGTSSSTPILNQATVSYEVGGAAQPDVTSPAASFVVDNKVSLTVATLNGTYVSVAPNSTGGTGINVLTFTVTNNGNTVQDYSLTAIQAAITDPFNANAADKFDAAVASIRVESNAGCVAPQTYDSAADTGTYISELGEDACRIVYVISNIGAQANNDVAAIALLATTRDGGNAGVMGGITAETAAADDPAVVDVVFADAANADVDNDDAVDDDDARDGEASERSAYRVSAAILTIGKTATTIWDPINGNTNPKAIPGALIRYVITITNDALASNSATLTSVTDGLVGTLAIDPDLKLPAACAAPPCLVTDLASESADGSGFKVVRPAGRTNPDTAYYTTTSSVDGIDFADPTMTATMTTVMPADDIAPVGAGAEDYAAGELKPGESVTVTFNVIVQ